MTHDVKTISDKQKTRIGKWFLRCHGNRNALGQYESVREAGRKETILDDNKNLGTAQ